MQDDFQDFPHRAQLNALHAIPDGFRTPAQTAELYRLSQLWRRWLVTEGRRRDNAAKVAAQREKDARRVAREAAREAKRQAKEAGRKVWEENMRKAAEKQPPRCPHCPHCQALP